jgi:hypothetical protein
MAQKDVLMGAENLANPANPANPKNLAENN